MIENPDFKQVETALGTEREMAARLETITDEVWQLTRDCADQNIPFLRSDNRTAEEGVRIILAYTVERPDGDFASIVQETIAKDGSKKIIERRWSPDIPSDASRQKVVNSRVRVGGRREPDPEYPARAAGFKSEDIDRMEKLIALFKGRAG